MTHSTEVSELGDDGTGNAARKERRKRQNRSNQRACRKRYLHALLSKLPYLIVKSLQSQDDADILQVGETPVGHLRSELSALIAGA
jgi:hypothetical protein